MPAYMVYVNAERRPCKVVAKRYSPGMFLPRSAGRYNRRVVTAYSAASAKDAAFDVRCPVGVGRVRRRRRR